MQALLEFAAKFAASHQRGQIQREDGLVLQPLRHIAVDQPLRQAFGDSGLAHAGLADQHRIILGAPADDVYQTPNLFVAPDDRVKLALPRIGRQIPPELAQALVGRFRVLAGDALAAADALQGFQDVLMRNAIAPQDGAHCLVFRQRQQQVLGAGIFIAHLLGFGFRLGEYVQAGAPDWHAGCRLRNARQLAQLAFKLNLQRGRMRADLLNDPRRQAVVLRHQSEKDVHRFHRCVMALRRDSLRLEQGLLRFVGVAAKVHIASRLICRYDFIVH